MPPLVTHIHLDPIPTVRSPGDDMKPAASGGFTMQTNVATQAVPRHVRQAIFFTSLPTVLTKMATKIW